MSALVLIDPEVVAGPVRFTTTSMEVKLDIEADEKDSTTFGSSGWRTNLAGLRKGSLEASGYWDASPPETGALSADADLFATLGGAQQPAIITPTGADGSVAYIMGVRRGSMKLWDKIGEMAPFVAGLWGDGQVARGNLIHPATALRTGSGSGNGVQLGTVASGRNLLVALNVVTVGGTTPALTLTVQRDDNVGFTTPTTVTTLGPVSAPTSSLVLVPGPITPDDRYRVTWTLTGTTPTARFAVAVGITPPTP